jgi:alkylhydroperoxidase family enzyme
MVRRIAPAERSCWSDETRKILGATTPASDHPEGQGPPNILYTIAHHPTLLAPFLAFTAALALRGVLPRRDSEILALRASWNCRSAFEWGHHVEYALAAGIPAETIERIPAGPDHGDWIERDRLLLRVADELHRTQQLDDSTYAELKQQYSIAEIVEITFVVGNYTMLSMVANATGVPLEGRLPPFPGLPE